MFKVPYASCHRGGEPPGPELRGGSPAGMGDALHRSLWAVSSSFQMWVRPPGLIPPGRLRQAQAVCGGQFVSGARREGDPEQLAFRKEALRLMEGQWGQQA